MLPTRKYTAGDYLSIARKRGPLVLPPVAVCLLVALIYSSRLPNVYQAEMLVQIIPQRVPSSYVQSTVTIKTEDRLEALGQQVTSRTQLERIILDFNLYARERATRPMQDVVEMMRPNVSIDPVRPNRMAPVEAFYLRFQYGDPVLAARVTERLGTLYIDYNARERGALAEATKEFLVTQLAEARTRLEAQEQKLEQFRERHAGRLPSQLESNMQAIQSTQLQRQAMVESLARDRDRKLMLERLYNDALVEPVPVNFAAVQAAANPATLATMSPQQRLEAERANLGRLQQRLTDEHPDIRRAKQQIADLEKQVAATPAGNTPAAVAGVSPEELQRRERISAMRAEIESLDRQVVFKESEERRMSAVIGEYQTRIEAVPGVESEWLSLSRDYDSVALAFKDLLSKSELAKSAVDLENRQVGEQFRVLDAPRVPGHPISPARLIITAAGLGIGLLLGLVLAVLLEFRDASFRSEADIEQVLGLPVIALVPNLLTVADRRRMRNRRLVISATAMLVIGAGGYVFWAMQLWKFVA